jgi:peptidoglycan-N-acetylglucosamine deacetylase
MVADARHEIGGHGYLHENPEQHPFSSSAGLIATRVARRPWSEMSVVTAELLLKHRFAYDHSQAYRDLVPSYARAADQWTKIDYTTLASMDVPKYFS